MKRLTFLPLIPILFFYSSAFSELKFSTLFEGLGLYAGISLPLWEFGENGSIDNAGFANPGPCAGIKYDCIFKSGVFGWSFDGSVVMNTLDRKNFANSFRNENVDNLNTFHVSSIRVEGNSWWFNVPLLTGPTFNFRINPFWGIYTTVLAGASLLKAPKVTVSGYYENGVYIGNVVYAFKLTAVPCLVFDAGFKFDVVTIGARFSYMINKEINGSYTAGMFAGTSEQIYTKKIPITAVQVLLGYIF